MVLSTTSPSTGTPNDELGYFKRAGSPSNFTDITTAGELVHCDFSKYPNIKRWLDNFKTGPNYAKVYETFTGFCASTKGQPWQAI